MRVGQLGGDVELKVLMVRNHGVSQLDDEAARLLEGLPQQDGLQGGVQFLQDILQETRLSKTHSVLQAAQEVSVR